MTHLIPRPLRAATVAATAMIGFQSGQALAQTGGYGLGNPTPRAQMRELSTDRPDQTESPYTVDAGRIQLEMDLWNFERDRERDGALDVRTKTTAYAPFNLKFGLSNAVDLQIVADTYLRSSTRNVRTGAQIDRADGFGDVTARLKVNLWGNDGGPTALALMPFIKVPTAAAGLGNDKVEGGLIVPLAVELSDRAGLGLMTEIDVVRNDANSSYVASFINTATIGFDLSERLGMYTEVAAEKSTQSGSAWSVSFDSGLTYALTDDVQLDAGVNVGLTKAAPDLNPFVGITFRF